MEATHTGGCLCGQTRFEAQGAATEAGWCHCRMCQRSSGTAASAYVVFAPGAVEWRGRPPGVFRSSARGRRLFCTLCGSQLAYVEGNSVSVNSGCLDRPEDAPPDRHIWCESRLSWFPDDGLPRHQQDG